MISSNEHIGLEILQPDKRGYINFYPSQKDSKPVKKHKEKKVKDPIKTRKIRSFIIWAGVSLIIFIMAMFLVDESVMLTICEKDSLMALYVFVCPMSMIGAIASFIWTVCKLNMIFDD